MNKTQADKLKDNSNIFISIVVPVYNEEENIETLTERLLEVLRQYKKFEIIYVNDGSTDSSQRIIEDLCVKNRQIKLVNFSRNFGHQTAISAGLTYSEGDAVIVMDGDLQDPPEVLPQFIDKWKEGYDVVYAIRKNRKEHALKRTAYYMFYRFLNRLTDIKIPPDSGDFSIMDKKIVRLINMMPERNRFVRGIRSYVGFKQVGLEYDRQGRIFGKPKYTFKKLFKLAADGIFSFSRKPLSFASNLGIVITLFSFILIVLVLFLKIFTNTYIPGFAGITMGMLFLGGVQLFVIGVLGEYIGRIYDEVKNRPIFLVQSTKNIEIDSEL